VPCEKFISFGKGVPKILMRRAALAFRKSLHGRSFAEAETVRTPKRTATEIVNARCLRLPIESLSHFVGRNVPSLERAARAALALPPAAYRSYSIICASRFSDSGMNVPSKYRHAVRARASPPARPRGSGASLSLRSSSYMSLDCTLEVDAWKRA